MAGRYEAQEPELFKMHTMQPIICAIMLLPCDSVL